MKKPELLLPAGNLEKARTALLYGADAIYIGGQQFSLRAQAGNADDTDMKAVIDFAHFLEKKVRVTVNIIAHNQHLKELPTYLERLGELGADGLIIADLGILSMAHRILPQIPITVSTQASISNYEAAAVCKELGASRIVLAREVSLEEMIEIKQKVPVELEAFIHGAMCMAYSGRCLLSKFMTGRSANLGECTQPCRYHYFMQEEKRPGQYFGIEEDQHGSYILNSKDLCLIEQIPELMEAGIDSFKVEGRMKSPLYVASVGSVYRQAIDRYAETRQPFTAEELHGWKREIENTSTRPFTTGFIHGMDEFIQDMYKEDHPQKTEFCGMVQGYDAERGCLIVQQRANFGPGEALELFLPGGSAVPLAIEHIYDAEGMEVDRARHPKQLIYIPAAKADAGTILRRHEHCENGKN